MGSQQPRELLAKEYWDQSWARAHARRWRPWNYYHRDQFEFLRQFLRPGARFLELGCGGSIWMAHLAADAEVWGIDYSVVGLEQITPAATRRGARLVCGDAFDRANGIPRNYFDVVFSDGLVEHFEDGVTAMEQLAEYVRPGGVMITSVPNMYGVVGRIHKVFAPAFYAAHVRHTPSSLDDLHRRVGLEVLSGARHWGRISLGVFNYERVFARIPGYLRRAVFLYLLALQQFCAWAMALFRVSGGSAVSPHLRGAYRRRTPSHG